MLERRAGHLVAIGSLAAYRGLPGAAAYSAAKAGLTNMMESLRIDLRPRGVDVSVIAPGFVRVKPGKKRRPFQVELEDATRIIHRAILARRSYYAFPTSLAHFRSPGLDPSRPHLRQDRAADVGRKAGGRAETSLRERGYSGQVAAR